MQVHEYPSRYTVTAVTPGEVDRWAGAMDIHVELAKQMDGSEKWAVRWMGRAIHRSGRWDYEPIPSGRTDRWLKSHRFDLRTAMKLAREAAPLLVLNGLRPDGSVA